MTSTSEEEIVFGDIHFRGMVISMHISVPDVFNCIVKIHQRKFFDFATEELSNIGGTVNEQAKLHRTLWKSMMEGTCLMTLNTLLKNLKNTGKGSLLIFALKKLTHLS